MEFAPLPVMLVVVSDVFAPNVKVLPLKLTVGLTVAVPRTVEVVVSVKVTEPVGPEEVLVVPVNAEVVKVAVSGTLWPAVMKVAPAARAGVTVNGATVMVTEAVAGLKVLSPE
jgi:hypothetical protein